MTSRETLSAEFESNIKDEKNLLPLEVSNPGVVDKYFASLAEERGQSLAEYQRKYNFDFVKEVPLPGGRYEWYPVNSSHENDDHDSEKIVTKTSGAG